MAQAVHRGATSDEIGAVDTRLKLALEAGVDDLMWADAVIFGTPENFGYMSGALKDFFDRTFYPCEGELESLPYAVFISAGNDGTGALSAIQRIARGYPLREIQDPIISTGELSDEVLARCETLGMSIAAGLEIGIF